MLAHKHLETTIMNMRIFIPQANTSIKILVKKNFGIVYTYIINNFACVVEFCFRYCINFFLKKSCLRKIIQHRLKNKVNMQNSIVRGMCLFKHEK